MTREAILDILLLFLTFLLGFLLFKNSQILPKCHISKFIRYEESGLSKVKGVIENDPAYIKDKTVFIFRTEAIESGGFNYACCGNILVKLRGRKDLCYGESLILEGNLYKPYRDYIGRQNIGLIMSSGSGIVNLNKNKGLILKRLAFWLKRKTQEIIYKHVSSLTAAILDAMILGERKNIPWFVDDAMMKSGTVHIIVVSGFNVSIITFILLLFLKIVRVPPQARFFIAITCLILYCLATGASTPVVRATVMAVFFLAGYLLKREPDIYNSLSIAAIAILAVNPRQLSDIGFQLSFISVLSIVYLYPKLKLLLRTEALRMRLFKFIAEGYLVSFSAWLGTMGPIAYYFKIFSPVAVLANIFIVPLATLITLSGISLIAVSLICPGLAPFFAFTTELEVFALLKVNAFLVNLPFAYLRFL